jgi:small subunit ribosomal protein S7
MRRRAAEKRDVLPTPSSGTRRRQVHQLPDGGRQEVRRRGHLYNAFDRMQKRTGRSPIEMFHDALANVRPMLEVRSRRVGGATYQVPSRSGRSGGRRSRRAG